MVERRSVKCLVVDDDHDGADIVGEFLKLLGADVRVVYSGQEALDVAPNFTPRMVVLDINMPNIDGFETCRRLRRQPWSGEAVFIAHTGMPSPRADSVAAGFDVVVSMGDPAEVFETILNRLAAQEPTGDKGSAS